jgi:hypothetical protein
VNGDADDDFGDFGDFDEGAPAFVEQEAAPLPAAQPPADASLVSRRKCEARRSDGSRLTAIRRHCK